MNVRHRILFILMSIVVSSAAIPTANRLQAQPAGHVVISEVYGGGGNSGATFTHDFIELYNPTGADVVMSGWSVQYQSGSGTGAFTAVAKFSGIIRAHRFFLIQANPGSGGTVPLPAPDAVAGITLAASSGKVALVADTASVTGPGSPGVVDFVGYGTANAFEGAAPATSAGNAASVERKASSGSDAASMGPGGAEEHSGNARDSGDNGADFLRRDPEPQNDASAAEAPGGSLSVTTAYQARWNLVSLPVEAGDPSVGTLFPGAQSPLYAYAAGYLGESTATRGKGYWVRFAEPETVTFTGAGPGVDTLVLSPGWNLVGAGAEPLAAASLPRIPPGHIPGGFYRYDGGYLPADTLWPGHAYWARSIDGGKLVLASGGTVVAGTVHGVPDGELPPPPPGVATSPGRERDDGMADGGIAARIWPNPFNPETRLSFTLPGEGKVRIEILDPAGRSVDLLLDGSMPAGEHAVAWNATRHGRRGVAAGTYFARIVTPWGVTVRKLLYLR